MDKGGNGVTKAKYKKIEDWYKDRILAGSYEEEGSSDTYEDDDGFCWFITKREDGKFDMTTENNPIPFAIGMITKTGKARINWV